MIVRLLSKPQTRVSLEWGHWPRAGDLYVPPLALLQKVSLVRALQKGAEEVCKDIMRISATRKCIATICIASSTCTCIYCANKLVGADTAKIIC